MPVPAAWGDISDTAASNSPAGSESVGPNMNAYLQAAFAYCKQLYEGQQNPTGAVPFNGQKITGLANGTASGDGVNFGQLSTYCAIGGGWTVTGAVGFSSGVTFYSAVQMQQQVLVTGAGTVNVTSSNSQAFTVQATGAPGSGPHIHLFDAPTGGRKYIRCASNQLQVVNANYNGTPLILDDAGNLTCTGNIIAYSDERVKTDWKPVASDFIDVLATAVKSGTYQRTDIEMDRQAGVSAQDLRNLLPEVVQVNEEDGMLGVAYGQAALVACVELAKEVVRLRTLLESMQ
jgi:hypothetical protein